ncbi:hypothetical protein X975_07179, partial [Stegodyphus mimosarum]
MLIHSTLMTRTILNILLCSINHQSYRMQKSGEYSFQKVHIGRTNASWGTSVSFTPFLEQTNPLASAIGTPKVASTGRTEAAIAWSMIATTTSADATSLPRRHQIPGDGVVVAAAVRVDIPRAVTHDISISNDDVGQKEEGYYQGLQVVFHFDVQLPKYTC